MTYTPWRRWAETAVQRVRQDDDFCSVLVVDVDRFKSVNDRYGHLAGDVVVSSIAEVVQAAARGPGHDVVGRFGGDEFVVFVDCLPDGSAAPAIADRIRREVEALEVTVDAGAGPVRVTGLSVSVGVASVSGARPDRGLDRLLWAADRALYDAKRAGRNTVRVVDLPEGGATETRGERPR